MKKGNEFATKLISIVASVALVVGLMPLPAFADAADGSNTPMVFPEQQNGDYESDYASPAKELTLTVDNPDVIEVSTWDDLRNAALDISPSGGQTNAKTIRLVGDIERPHNGGHIIVNKLVTIDLNGHKLDRKQASADEDGGNGRVITVYGGGRLTIKDRSSSKTGTITGGWANKGGGIYVCENGTLNFDGGVLVNNSARYDGGGIYVEANGTLNLDGGIIRCDSKEYHLTFGKGGGVFVAGTMNMNSGSIAKNWADDDGGGVYVAEGGTLNLDDGTISGNTTGGISFHSPGGKGGGVCVAGTMNMNGGSITENTASTENSADGEGGGIHVEKGGTLNFDGGTISGNIAESDGGGISVYGTLSSKDAESYMQNPVGVQGKGGTIADNTAQETGGGIYVESSGSIFLYCATVSGNTAKDGGGGVNVHLKDATGNSIAFCIITDNRSSDYGGGIRMTQKDATLVVKETYVGGNRALDGGGVYAREGKVEMSGGSISRNTAWGGGGGVKVHGGAEFAATDVVIEGNNAATDEGGGIKNDGTVTLSGCCYITGNKAEKLGGGIYADDGITNIEGALTVMYNSSGFGDNVYLGSGCKLKCTGSLEGAQIGVDLEDRVGTITEGYDTHNHVNNESLLALAKQQFSVAKGYDLNVDNNEVAITSDWKWLEEYIEETMASNDSYTLDRDYAAIPSDGRIEIGGRKHITIDLNGHTLNRNCSSKTGSGHVFEVYGGSTLTIIDSSESKTGTITGGWSGYGGGIYVNEDGVLELFGGTITGNRASEDGGGVYLKEGAVFRLGVVYSEEGAEPRLEGGEIRGNTAVKRGGGVYVSDGAYVHVKGRPVVQGNHACEGNNIYLPTGTYLNAFTGALGDGAQIGVTLEDDWGVFTQWYSEHNGDTDPNLFFTSDEDFEVVLEDGEVALRRDTFGKTAYEDPFIDWNDQMKPGTDALTSRNWMAGISGERYLNEINMPGTHDAAMYNVQKLAKGACDETSKVGQILFGEGYKAGAAKAKTQTSYIDEQLKNGARVLDIRLIEMRKAWHRKSDGYQYYYWLDDFENVWLCHGNSEDTGCYLAWNRDDDYLSFAEVLGWVDDFLEKHPTETVILHIRPQFGLSTAIYDRTKDALQRLAVDQINDSTKEPFLYKESDSDSYFAPYTHMPQLKDCRGKIVLLFEDEDGVVDDYGEEVCGGFTTKGLYGDKYIDPTKYSHTASEQIESITKSYEDMNGYGYVTLPNEANENNDFLWHWELNCTGEDDKDNYWWHALCSTGNPIDLARVVNPTLVGSDKLFGSQDAGQYIGWVKMDAFEATYAEAIWRTNYFEGLQYCTVTVESGVENDERFSAQTYRLLKGTTITVPGNIYNNPHPQGVAFEGWIGPDSNELLQGAYTVDKDVTFTARWAIPSYSVRFDANVPASASTTCTGSMKDQSIACNEKKAIRANSYSLPGYNFNGWNTEADGTGTAFTDEEEVKNLTFEGGTVVLYAQWSGKPYQIAYQSDDAQSPTPHYQTAYFDCPGKLDQYSDTAFGWNSDGKKLHGWSGVGFGFFYKDGDGFCNLCGMPDADGNVANAELTADWVNNGQIVVTVTKDGEPQEGLAEKLVLVQGGTTFSAPFKFTNSKYVFDPADENPHGGQPAQLSEGEYELRFVADGYPLAVAQITYGGEHAVSVVFDYFTVSLTKDPVYAGFNKVQISGGVAVAGESNTVVARDGEKLSIETTVNEGYRFEEYTAVGVTPIWEGDDASKACQAIEVQGKADIMAHVSPIEYSVTVEGGTADKATATIGEIVSITANAPEPGKAFAQWAHVDDVNYGNPSSTSTTFSMPAKDVTATAVVAPIIIGGLNEQGYPYTGEPIIVDEVRVWLEGVDLTLTSDEYEISFGDNVDAGTATVTATMKSPRAGRATATFKVLPADISEATVIVAGQVYDGAERKPVPTVTWNGKTLDAGKDYEISAYANNVHAGNATVTVTGKGNFKDASTASGSFKIAPRPATITVNSTSKVVGEADPAFTGTVDGLVGAGDLGVIRYVRTNDDEAPGTYDGVLDARFAASADYDVTVTKGDFTIKEALTAVWLDGDGSVLQTKAYGKGDPVPAYDGKEPTKAATAQCAYTFTGWDGGTVEGTVTTYRPLFRETPVPAKKGTLTFDLGGGTIDGKASLTIEADVGDVITIPEAPVRDGYAFKYWKGSEYYPGDKYTVEGDHAFTAVWEKKPGGNSGGGSGGASAKGSSPATGDPFAWAVAPLAIAATCALLLALLAFRRRVQRK